MRLTKGQLKRIIREEYTRLKRQGLLSERHGEMHQMMDDLERAGYQKPVQAEEEPYAISFAYECEGCSGAEIDRLVRSSGLTRHDIKDAIRWAKRNDPSLVATLSQMGSAAMQSMGESRRRRSYRRR